MFSQHPFLRTGKSLSGRLIGFIILGSLGFVITPIVIRSLIDAILPTGDDSAILLAISVVFWAEMLSLISNYFVNRNIDYMVVEKTDKIYKHLLGKILKNRTSVSSEDIESMFFVTIPRILSRQLQQKWQRIRDTFVLIALIIVANLISFRAGQIVMILACFQLFLNVVITRVRKISMGMGQQYERKSVSLIRNWSSKREKYYDLPDSFFENFQQDLEIYMVESWKTKRGHSMLFNIDKMTRTVGIISVLIVSIFSIHDSTFSQGTLWAMLIVIFRITSPIESIIRYVLTSKSHDYNRDKLISWLDFDLPWKQEKSPGYRQIRDFLSNCINRNQNGIVIAKDLDREVFLQNARIYFETLENQKSNIAIVDLLEIPFEDVLQKKKKFMILHQFPQTAVRQEREKLLDQLTQAGATCIVVDDYVPNTENSRKATFLKAEFYNENDFEKPGEYLETCAASSVAHQQLVNHAFNSMIRDMSRLIKLKVIFSIYFFKDLHIDIDSKSHSIREVDHLCNTPWGTYLVITVSPLQDHSIVLNRIIPPEFQQSMTLRLDLHDQEQWKKFQDTYQRIFDFYKQSVFWKGGL